VVAVVIVMLLNLWSRVHNFSWQSSCSCVMASCSHTQVASLTKQCDLIPAIIVFLALLLRHRLTCILSDYLMP